MEKLEKDFKERLIEELRNYKYKVRIPGNAFISYNFDSWDGRSIIVYDFLGIVAKMCGDIIPPGKYTRLNSENAPNVPKCFLNYNKDGLGYKFEKFYDSNKSFSWLISYINRYL